MYAESLSSLRAPYDCHFVSDAERLVFYRCGSFFLYFFFFRRLIPEVTERIVTKLGIGHIFIYNCYLKNFV